MALHVDTDILASRADTGTTDDEVVLRSTPPVESLALVS